MGSEETQRLFEELANRFDRRQEPRQRDIFLVLAADTALSGGRGGEAERLRARLLQSNPHHLLRPFPTLREALHSSDMRDYVADLRRRFPTTHAEELLETMTANDPVSGGDDIPVCRDEVPVYKLREEPLPVPVEPFLPPQARKRSPTRSPYEVTASPTPAVAETLSGTAGRWLTTLLFIITLAFAILLAGYVLLRPILLGMDVL